MTADLVAFLRARLDEDRKIAFEAGNGGHDTWIYDPELVWNSDAGPREAVVRFSGSALAYVAAVDPIHGKYGIWNAQHIARHDPARVLAEVDAKRRILARHRPIVATDDMAKPEWVGGCDGCGLDHDGPWTPTMNDCPELRDLASIYREHPDYRPEWAPDA